MRLTVKSPSGQTKPRRQSNNVIDARNASRYTRSTGARDFSAMTDKTPMRKSTRKGDSVNPALRGSLDPGSVIRPMNNSKPRLVKPTRKTRRFPK